nr:hypothetical protein [Nocardia albiluteola]
MPSGVRPSLRISSPSWAKSLGRENNSCEIGGDEDLAAGFRNDSKELDVLHTLRIQILDTDELMWPKD